MVLSVECVLIFVAILDKVQVTIDGGSHSILALGQISVKDANTLLVTPYAEEHAKLIREAIEKSNLGLTPQQDQRFITIPIPKYADSATA